MKYIETLTHHCVDVKEELVGIDNSVRFREGHWSLVSEWSVVVSRCLPVIHRPTSCSCWGSASLKSPHSRLISPQFHVTLGCRPVHG